MNYAPLNEALAGVSTPVYGRDFSDVSKGFKEKFGARGWTSELAKSISGTADKQSHEYKAALRNVQRYEKGTHNPERASVSIKQAIEQAGLTVDPIRKDVSGGVTLKITFNAPPDSVHAARDGRVAEVSLGAAELYDYVNQKGQPEYFSLFQLWFKNGGHQYGEGGAYEADVTDVEVA